MSNLGFNAGEGTRRPGGGPHQDLIAGNILDQGYWPGRGLVYSFLAHQVLFFGLLFISISGIFSGRVPVADRMAVIDPRLLNEVIYMPVLDAGPSALPAPAEPLEAPQEDTSTESASNDGAVTYPGPQPILSDFPVPTVPIQTLLRPALEDLLPVESPLILPNIVQIARAERLEEPTPEAPPAPPEPAQPESLTDAAPGLLEQVTRVELPELALPIELQTSSPIDTAESISRFRAPPEPATPEMDLSGVALAELPLSNGLFDPATLISLSPFPASADQAVTVSLAELRGRFRISPEADPPPPGAEPGLPVEAPKDGSGEGSPAAGSSAADDGRGDDGAGTASGPGGDQGSRWVTIGGESSMTGIAANPAPVISLWPAARSAPLETGYGLTVISTENSGGGLPDLGVFSNEKVHTVYLDMKQTETDMSQSWILEFAVQRPPTDESASRQDSDRGPQELTLPYPTVKEHPAWPPDLVERYVRRLVIVYGVVNIQGKLEHMEVKQSPDKGFNEPLLRALAGWVFQPAQFDGEPVSAKLLLGIPLSLSD